MVVVGLMGGACYVNVMYLVLESQHLFRTEKELAITITSIGDDFGILLASILSLILDTTAFKSKWSNLILLISLIFNFVCIW